MSDAMKIILSTIRRRIYGDRMTICYIGVGVGWAGCNLVHQGPGYLIINILTTVIFCWADNVMRGKGE